MCPEEKITIHPYNVPGIVLIAFIFMAGYEVMKQAMFPNISEWVSSLLTTIVVTAIVTVSSLFLKNRIRRLNGSLEKMILKRTIELKETNEKLKKEIEDKKIVESNLQTSKNEWEKTFDAIDDWISMTDLTSRIQRTNRTGEKFFGISVQKLIGQKCCRLLHGTDEQLNDCPLPIMLKSGRRESVEIEIKDGRWMLITVDPMFNSSGKIVSVVHIARDITQRINIQKERERLLIDLQKARATVATLSGLIPICASCKKIRDDEGYWNQVESFIKKHADVEFSHGICPECIKKHYPDINIKK